VHATHRPAPLQTGVGFEQSADDPHWTHVRFRHSGVGGFVGTGTVGDWQSRSPTQGTHVLLLHFGLPGTALQSLSTVHWAVQTLPTQSGAEGEVQSVATVAAVHWTQELSAVRQRGFAGVSLQSGLSVAHSLHCPATHAGRADVEQAPEIWVAPGAKLKLEVHAEHVVPMQTGVFGVLEQLALVVHWTHWWVLSLQMGFGLWHGNVPCVATVHSTHVSSPVCAVLLPKQTGVAWRHARTVPEL
jgi:hypothetical protein